MRILEDSTTFHWGRDCLVWIVHYPEELVDPLAESEASRTGMTDLQRDTFKANFKTALSIGQEEPFLFTVSASSSQPFSFSPLSEKLALVTENGERVKPVRYDRKLDEPINGIVQGLVFFPKQPTRNFDIALKGMGVYDEDLFSFEPQMNEGDLLAALPEGSVPAPADPNTVVFDIEPLPQPPSPPPPPLREVPQVIRHDPPVQAAVTVVNESPAPPAPPQPAPPAPVPQGGPEIVVIEPEGVRNEETQIVETQSMEDFVASMRAGRRSGNEESPAGAENDGNEGNEEGAAGETEETGTGGTVRNSENAYSSRESVLRAFLDLWVKNDADAMYAMLSAASQETLSQDSFRSHLRTSTDFRGALRDGYTVEWLDTERAKVVAAKRILLIRTLVDRVLGVVREGSVWKIVW